MRNCTAMLKYLFILQLEKNTNLFLFLLNFILKVVAFAVYAAIRFKNVISFADISMDRNSSRELNVIEISKLLRKSFY
jgi:hypothetical protein